MVGNELSRLFVVIGAKTEGFNKSMDGVSNKMQKTSRNMKIAGGIMVAAVAAIGIASLKMAADFDQAFRKVNVMLQASEEEIGNYKSQLLGISSATAQAVTKVTDAYYKIVSAGYRGADSIDILRIAMEGATGGAADTLLTTEALTKAMNIFELEGVGGATKAMDSFFGIVDAGLLSFEELATSFPRAASNAAGLNVSIEETGALLATLTKVLGTTEQAATATDAIFRLLISPSADLLALYEEWGVKSGPEAIAQFGGLTGVLKKLKEATEGEVTAVRALFSSDEAMKGILPILTSQYENYNEAVVTVTNSQGRAKEAFDEMAEGVTFKWNKAIITIKNGLLTIGTALLPAMTKILNFIIPILKKMEDWIGKHTNLTIAVLAGVAALGALLLVGGFLLPMLSTAIASLHLVTAAQWAWNIAMTANPIGLLIAAIGLLVVAIVGISRAWKDNTETMREELAEQTRLVQEAVDKQRQAILGTTSAKLDALQKERNAASEGNRQRQLDSQKEQALDDILTDEQIENMKEAGATQEEIDKARADSQEGLMNWMYAAYDKQLEQQMDTVREAGDSQIAALNELASHWQLVIDKAKEYTETVGMVTMTEPKFWPPAYPLVPAMFGENATIPKFQTGGLITKPTIAMLGERGPELVLPLQGSDSPLGEGAGNINNYFSISGMVVREEADIKRIATELYRLQRINARAAGIA